MILTGLIAVWLLVSLAAFVLIMMIYSSFPESNPRMIDGATLAFVCFLWPILIPIVFVIHCLEWYREGDE